MAKMYDVRIKGTIQANGPKPVDRWVRMDETQKRMFTGGKRKEALEGWVRANYPSFTKINTLVVVECKSIKEE
jgi:hypothetical protein